MTSGFFPLIAEEEEIEGSTVDGEEMGVMVDGRAGMSGNFPWEVDIVDVEEGEKKARRRMCVVDVIHYD